ncbi:MAG TPA: phosphoribosyl-ATP diphosphatase, partial [Allosphingosinicella sp.]
LADPEGPTCHTGTQSCFGGELGGPGWLADLSRVVAARAAAGGEGSYTSRLLSQGTAKIAQKVGEEGVEVALAAVTRDTTGCAEETADLLYHLAVLMQDRGYSWEDVVAVLKARHSA